MTEMPFINTPNVVRCAIRYTLYEQDIVNTLWFRNTVDALSDPLVIAAFADNLGTWVEENLMPLLSDDLTLVDTTVTSQETSTAPSVTHPLSVPGEVTGTAEPNAVAFVIKFNTAQRGRSGRGRNYISGLPDTAVVGNAVSETLANNLVTAYNTLIGAPIGNFEWVVVSFWDEGVERAQGFPQEVLSASYTTLFVRSQRRRNAGIGS